MVPCPLLFTSRHEATLLDFLTEEEIMERLMTVDEVAEYLRLNREVVLRKARKGEIPAVKVGSRSYRLRSR